MQLEGKVIAVTGAVGLIGSALSREIVKQGGKVIMGDNNLHNCGAIINDIGADSASAEFLDVTSKKSIKYFIDQGSKKFGNLHAIVHCAYPRSSTWGVKFEDLNEDGLREDLYSQLGGAILVSQQFYKYFLSVGSGKIIHISSIQGVRAPKFEHYDNTNMVSPIEYSAIKSGIISLVQYLAKYSKDKNIQVNCISPGGILNNQPDIFLNKYKKSCLSKGMLDPVDLVGTLLYLLNPINKYINGQNIIIDDGWSL